MPRSPTSSAGRRRDHQRDHRLVVVASEMDSSTERIVDYLLDSYGVPVNVVFLRYFRDAGSEYLGRHWLKSPTPPTRGPREGAKADPG